MGLNYVLLEPNAFGVVAIFGFFAAAGLSLRKKIRTSLLVAAPFTALRCAHELTITHGYHPDFAAYFRPVEHYAKSWSALFWLIAPLSIVLLKPKAVHRIGLWLFFIAAAFTAVFQVFGNPQVLRNAFADAIGMGIIYNPSMNVALLACLLPFLDKCKPYLSIIAEISVAYFVFKSGHLTPIVAYAAVQFCRLAIWDWRFALTAFCVTLSAAALMNGVKLDSHGRWTEYVSFYRDWRAHWSTWFGMGVNKFAIYGPILQSLRGWTRNYFVYLHSDLLQIFFEQGIVGAVLWGWVGVDALVQAFHRDRVLFTVGVASIASAVGYFPWHTSAGAVVVVLVLSVLKKNPTPEACGVGGANGDI